MFFAIISTSQWTINTIQKIPTTPKYPPNCIYNIITTFDKKYNYSYNIQYYNYNNCNLTSDKPKYNFEKEYNILKPDYEKLKNIYTYINKQKYQIDNNKIKIEKYKKNYNLSLTEKISNKKNKILNKKKKKYRENDIKNKKK